MSIIDSIVSQIFASTEMGDEAADFDIKESVEEFGDPSSGIYEKVVTKERPGYKVRTSITVANQDKKVSSNAGALAVGTN